MKQSIKAVIVLAALATAGGRVLGDESGNKGPVGAWEKKIGDNSIRFDVGKDTFKATLTSADGSIVVNCEYSMTKDHVLYGIVRKIEKKGTCAGPSEGDMFNFRFKIDGDTLTIKDLKGSTDSEEAKQVIEGEFKAVK